MRYTELVNKATAAFLSGGISQAKVDAFFARHGPHLQALIAAKDAKKAGPAWQYPDPALASRAKPLPYAYLINVAPIAITLAYKITKDAEPVVQGILSRRVLYMTLLQRFGERFARSVSREAEVLGAHENHGPFTQVWGGTPRPGGRTLQEALASVGVIAGPSGDDWRYRDLSVNGKDVGKAIGIVGWALVALLEGQTPYFDGAIVKKAEIIERKVKAVSARQGRAHEKNPPVVYHGTTAGGFDRFKPFQRKNEQLGFGVHFAEDRELADLYAADPTVARKPKQGGRRQVYTARLDVTKPLLADSIVYEGSPEFALAKKLAGSRLMTQTAEDGRKMTWMQNAIDATGAARAVREIVAAGYDAIRYQAQVGQRTAYGHAYVTKQGTSWVVLDPDKIKVVRVDDVVAAPGR